MTRLFWLGAALALAGAACDEDNPIGGSGSGGSTGSTTTSAGAGGPRCGELANAFLEESCQRCATDSCCDELAACDANAACAEQFGCVRSCGADAACQGSCPSGGGDEALAALGCMSGCDDANACSAPSTVCDTSFSAGSATCDACLGDACCAETQSCLADDDCAACLESGEGNACDTDALFSATTSCFADACADVCEG